MREVPNPRVEVQIAVNPENPDESAYSVWLYSPKGHTMLFTATGRQRAIQRAEIIADLVGWEVVIATLQPDDTWATEIHPTLGTK